MKWLYALCFVLLACENDNKTSPAQTESTKEQTTKSADSFTKNKPIQNTEQEIVPGQRIGKVKLGENVSSLEVLGPPDKSDAAMGKAWLTWKGKRDEHNNFTELDVYTTYKDSTMQEKTVHQVRTTSSQFTTANNIHVYSSLQAIEQEFSEVRKLATYNDDGRDIAIYDAVEKGIAFEIAKANGQQICTGIIVHQKNKKVTDIYIMLHPDMKRF
jgi:hypothetical protein